jgi:Transglutaminase-like superfamily
MKQVLVIFVFLFAAGGANSYGQNKEFAKFVGERRQFMNDAYERKDIMTFNMYFDQLLNEYRLLNAKDKKEFKGRIDGAYYDRACTYAITGYKQAALDNLERSEFYNYDHLVEDHDMDALREEPRFIKFLAEAKKRKPDYLATLKKGAQYNCTEKCTFPKFTYQESSDPNLRMLRVALNLDSIAGTGSEVSQMINLMRWVHYLVPHDGSKGNPDVKNALSFIDVCRRDGKTLNCRGLAILLNEVYLAVGFKSRFVTCLPKDTTDNDCHVITMVWANDLKKWIWMDPTFNAYVMNEKGDMLSIEEVRERLIAGKPLILNPDADRNRQTTQTKKDYLDTYMAKNLYRLECPVSSEYNYETKGQGKERAYVSLVPMGDIKKPVTAKDKHGMTTYSLNYTGNPTWFWAAPPMTTKADFEAAMGRFKKYYNHNEADSICNMFSYSWGEYRKTIYTTEKIESIKKAFGDIVSYEYLGVEPEDGVTLFRVVCTKSTHATGLSLDRENNIGTFRFKTSSGFINDLLAKSN